MNLMKLILQPLRKYGNFSGRARRAEYWSFTLLVVFVWLVFAGILYLIESRGGLDGFQAIGVLIWAIMAAFAVAGALLIPTLALYVRRLHDLDKSGWWCLLVLILTLIPFVGAIAQWLSFMVYFGFFVVYLGFFKGTTGKNRFGKDPLMDS